MTKSTFRAFFAAGALAAIASAAGCVADRPSRNGVFNENQYVKKSFLTTDGSHDDPGWFYQGTVTKVSTPNAFGSLGVYTGIGSLFGPLGYVKFLLTQDKLQMANQLQIENTGSLNNTPEIVNAWPITNVDLKYRVNLDGEKTNFYEENQELDWQLRQWVKIAFAKNDMSDVFVLGPFTESALALCADLGSASATLVPNSFRTEEYDDWHKDYMQFEVNITVPLQFTNAQCTDLFGSSYDGISDLGFGRANVSFNIKYSFMRVKPLDDPSQDPDAYVPLVLDEKDPIKRKYGFFQIIKQSRDPDTRMLAARELTTRFNPNKPTTYYFLPGMPPYILDAFLGHRQYTVDDNTGSDSRDTDTAQTCMTAGCTRLHDGIMDKTNEIFARSGAKIRLNFLNWNDDATFGDAKGPNREFGDIRYTFIHWIPDIDENNNFLGEAGPASDPRTGETLHATVNLSDSESKAMAYQIDYYLQSIGASQGLGYTDKNGNPAEWPKNPPGQKGTCTYGQKVPIQPSTEQANHNGNSSLFQKIQLYLGKNAGTYGNLGPQDFIAQQDDDFFKAYYTLVPYWIFMDPDANPYVIREGGAGIFGPQALSTFWDMQAKETEFHKVTSDIDHGLAPFTGVTGPDGLKNATEFANHFRDLTVNHRNYTYMLGYLTHSEISETTDAFSLPQIADHAARHCIVDENGSHWETKQEWVDNMIHSFYEQIAIHEFGHSLGLYHNFMGSLDKPHFPVMKDQQGNPMKEANGNPRYALYTNSVMEYTVRMGDVFDTLTWGPYDQGALGWGYSNNANLHCVSGDADPTHNSDAACVEGATRGPKALDPNGPVPKSLYGQVDHLTPWNDVWGFEPDPDNAGQIREANLLNCHDYHSKYTPTCRTFDVGVTPSEIIANGLDSYEWAFNFRNYRVYRKYWDNHHYANTPANMVIDMRRFLPAWFYDWDSGDVSDTLRRLGYQTPKNVPAQAYYSQLTNKFNLEMSRANQMVAAFVKAVINESAGERPWATIYDKFYGDVTQQGIILDKLFAAEFFTGLWPNDNYNPSLFGAYLSSFSETPDASYQTVAEDAIDSLLGGQYNVPPYFAPLVISLFAQDTHSPAFGGRIEVRDWIGGKKFLRLEDFLAYFRDIAVHANYISPDAQAPAWVVGQSANYSHVNQGDQVTLGYDSAPDLQVTFGSGGTEASVVADINKAAGWAFASYAGGEIRLAGQVTTTGQHGQPRGQVRVMSDSNAGQVIAALGLTPGAWYAQPKVDCSHGWDSCQYDPRAVFDNHNEFISPDYRKWIWAYIADRNEYLAVQKERNSASYVIVRSYNDDVVYQLDDGQFPGGAYGSELPMKYFLDAFDYYN